MRGWGKGGRGGRWQNTFKVDVSLPFVFKAAVLADMRKKSKEKRSNETVGKVMGSWR